MFCLWSSYIWIIWQWQDYYDWYWKWGKFFLYLLYFFSFSLQIAQMWLATTHSFTFSNHKLQLDVLIIGVIIIIIILVLIICICCCFKSGRKCLKGIISCFCGYAIGNYLSEKLFWTFIIAYNFFINRRHEIHKIIKQRYIPTRGTVAKHTYTINCVLNAWQL